MELGLNPDEVRLVDHTPGWKAEFQKVQTDLLENTSIPASHIEHIGSTAIPGIPAKPVIDIMAAVEDLAALEKELITGLKKAGFLQLKVKRPWKNLLFFRDYLNANEDARTEYSELKLEYIRKTSKGIKEYTVHKESFVKRIAELREKEASEG